MQRPSRGCGGRWEEGGGEDWGFLESAGPEGAFEVPVAYPVTTAPPTPAPPCPYCPLPARSPRTTSCSFAAYHSLSEMQCLRCGRFSIGPAFKTCALWTAGRIPIPLPAPSLFAHSIYTVPRG